MPVADYKFRLVLAFLGLLFFVMMVISFYAFHQGKIIELIVIFTFFLVCVRMFVKSFTQTR
jgi:hypothetical protein